MEKTRELQKNFCFIDCAKAFDCVDHNKVLGYLMTVSWETCMRVKKQQLESDMKWWTGLKLGKEYNKAVYCHPAYLTSMQSTS